MPPARTQAAAAADVTPRNHAALARRLCHAMAAIHRRGWCDGTGGNFSCVIQRDPLELLMAPSGVDKGRVRPADLIVVDREGRVVEGEGRVSAEMLLHRTIVENAAAGAVLHTHSQAATLLSRWSLGRMRNRMGLRSEPEAEPGAAVPKERGGRPGEGMAQLTIEGLEMLKGLEGIHSHDCRIQVPVLANDQDLRRLSTAAAPHLREAPHGLLIAGHGLYAWGEDLDRACRHLEILEFLLEQQWREMLLSALSTPLA